MWILAVKRPFYPDVIPFNTREEAEEAAKEWVRDEGEKDGNHDAYVYVAEVAFTQSCKTYY